MRNLDFLGVIDVPATASAEACATLCCCSTDGTPPPRASTLCTHPSIAFLHYIRLAVKGATRFTEGLSIHALRHTRWQISRAMFFFLSFFPLFFC